MPALEFVSKSARDPANPQATGERLVNLYAEPMPSGAQARYALKGVPGMASFATVPGVFVRSMINAPRYDSAGVPSDRLALVSNGALRLVDSGGVVDVAGTIPDDENTGLSTNNGAVTVTADGRYFLWNGSALTEPTPGVFSAFGGVEFLGDYTILTERNDRRFCWSALADPADLPSLSFATAETRDDVLLRPLVVAGNLWLFKTTSIEIWAATGSAGADAFQKLTLVETGLRGFNLLAKVPGGAFFVGADGIAYLTGGGPELQPISTPAVNEALRNGDPTHAAYYEHAGHKFCVIRFRDRPALCLDLVTGLWHERAEGENAAWGATCAAYAFGAWLFGGFNGAVKTAISAQTDSGEELIRRAVSMPLVNGGGLFKVPVLEVKADMGRSNLGRDAAVMLRISRDGGGTWGNWRQASLGGLGQYGKRAVFRSLGQARQFTAEVRLTDPAEIALWSSANVQVVA